MPLSPRCWAPNWSLIPPPMVMLLEQREENSNYFHTLMLIISTNASAIVHILKPKKVMVTFRREEWIYTEYIK